MPTDEPDEMAEFLADFQPLPAPGGFVSRNGGGPCAECGESVFEVARCKREAKSEDGTIRRWETVDVQCPRCPLLTSRTVIHKQVIGKYDTGSGRLDLGDAVPVDRSLTLEAVG